MDTVDKKTKSISDYKELFGTDIGQKVLMDLMKNHGVLQSLHCPGDPYSTAFNDGARSVVLRIMKRSKIDTKKMMELLDKMNQEQEENF